jgi:vacuolar-type H+-ATPase subunit E/Vma4
MPEEIKGLIEKIQKEGIQKASEDGRRIVEEAKGISAKMLEKAKKEADSIIQNAKKEAERFKESADAELKQAGRDFLILLRAQINALLKKIIVQKTSEALTTQEMAKIINTLVREYSQQQKFDKIEIVISKSDLAKMKEDFLGKLSEEAAKGLTLKASDDISAGFTISFDSGKSHFDFSDQSLAGYISVYLNKELASILN